MTLSGGSPLHFPLDHVDAQPIKELVELPEICEDLANSYIAETIDSFVVYYDNKEIMIPKSLVQLSVKDNWTVSLALEGLLHRELGSTSRDIFPCFYKLVLSLLSRVMVEVEEKLGEAVKARSPSFSSLLSKAIALELISRVEVLTDRASEIVYVKTKEGWIWGAEAENYLLQRALEIGNKIAEKLSERYSIDKLRAQSALSESTLRESVKYVTIFNMVPSNEIMRAISRQIIQFDGGFIDVDLWFHQGCLKRLKDVYGKIVIHRLPQDDFTLPSGTYEGLEDIERTAEIYTPTLLKAMREWVPDEDHRLNLWKAMGYAIYPKMPLRKFFLLVGPSGSGKSTFLDFMAYALGPENVSSVSLDQLLGPKSEYYVAELLHKLANLADEGINSAIVERRKRSLELLKALVGGSYITARSIYGRPFKFVNYAKLFFATNDERTVDLLRLDPAVAKRMVVIRFEGQFSDNPSFKDKLMKESRKALPVLLVALRVLSKQGFAIDNEEIVEMVKEICKRECVEGRKGLFLPASVIIKTFGISAKAMMEKLKEYGVKCKYHKSHGKRGLIFPKDFIEDI